MDTRKARKKYKHIVANPFHVVWNELSRTQTQQLISVLCREVNQQASNAKFQPELKRRHTESSNINNFCQQNMILGINNIAENIESIECLVMLKSKENLALLEPLFLLARSKGVYNITMSYEVAIQNLKELTGVKKLAAFALPKMNCFPMTFNLVKQFQLPNSRSFVPAQVKSVQI